jgi:hypothetical protein
MDVFSLRQSGIFDYSALMVVLRATISAPKLSTLLPQVERAIDAGDRISPIINVRRGERLV